MEGLPHKGFMAGAARTSRYFDAEVHEVQSKERQAFSALR